MGYLFNIMTLFELSFMLGLYFFWSLAPIIFISIMILGNFFLGFGKVASTKITKKIMNAALYSHDKGYVVAQIDVPKFSKDELLIEVKAGAINPVDFKLRTNDFWFLRWLSQPTVGRDFSGIVRDAGANVKDFKIGDEVFGNAVGGSLQEYTVVKTDQIALKPKKLGFAESASLGLAGATSFQALTHFFKDIANKKILIVGGSGGCGSFGIQIARNLSADVYSVCSTKNIEYVKDLGAKVFDYTNPIQMQELSKVKFDLVYDTVSSWDEKDGDQTSVYSKFLKEDGKYVSINGSKPSFFFSIVSTATGLPLEKKDYHLTLLSWNTKDLTILKDMADAGNLKSKCTSFKLTTDDVRKAFGELESRRTVGKIIVELSNI